MWLGLAGAAAPSFFLAAKVVGLPGVSGVRAGAVTAPWLLRSFPAREDCSFGLQPGDEINTVVSSCTEVSGVCVEFCRARQVRRQSVGRFCQAGALLPWLVPLPSSEERSFAGGWFLRGSTAWSCGHGAGRGCATTNVAQG